MKLALDSNVFIAYLQQDDAFFEFAKEVLKKVSTGENEAVFSALVFGEVMYGPHPNSSLGAVKEFFDELGSANSISADKDVCLKAAELRQQHTSLKLPDAIHLATAILAKADIFVTADKPLVKISSHEIKTIRLGNPIT